VTVSDFGPGLGATLLKFPPRDVPHITLEINRTCNMHCRCCYNIDRSWVKSFNEVAQDLDRAMTLRRIQAVTILGGEPTLHPDLPRIVALVKGRGLHCQLLTNGLRFLDPDGHALLRAVKSAGVDKILLHIDGGQAHVRGDIEAAREKLFSLMEAERVEFALSVTVYNEDRGRMSSIVRRYSRFRHFDGILAVLARDAKGPVAQTVELREEYAGLKAGLGLEPTAYVSSNLSDRDVRWLVYFYLADADGTRFYPFSPRLDRAFRRVFRLVTGRHLFGTNHGPAELRRIIVPFVLFETLTSPRRLASMARLFCRARSLKNVRLHFIAIQVPPELGPDGQISVICRSCPDATVRKGRLVPVCVADLVSPNRPSAEPAMACPAL
jgi:hypothetical protein